MNTSNVPKRLYRSRKWRMIAGVCGGLAEYFNLDPAWIRIIFILLALLGLGTFIIVYMIFWLIVPNAPEDSSSHGCPNCKT
ncbi:MAG: stress-responsive transcriptional regulator [uncultured bacterium]|nr:MAG: stress-responsive transcriptional regulator [uncultured bacterium]